MKNLFYKIIYAVKYIGYMLFYIRSKEVVKTLYEKRERQQRLRTTALGNKTVLDYRP